MITTNFPILKLKILSDIIFLVIVRIYLDEMSVLDCSRLNNETIVIFMAQEIAFILIFILVDVTVARVGLHFIVNL